MLDVHVYPVIEEAVPLACCPSFPPEPLGICAGIVGKQFFSHIHPAAPSFLTHYSCRVYITVFIVCSERNNSSEELPIQFVSVNAHNNN